MTYNPATDFIALWRNIAGVVSKVEMPGLDYVAAALARAGLITLSVSATAPTVSQQTTAWLHTAVPSNSAEGVLNLWNGAAYVPATPALFLDLLQASAGQNGTSWWTSTGGPPLNTVGNNGDFAVRLDEPNGIFGPKAAGAWPAQPIPGTADVITSTSLDNTFGTAEGALIVRGADEWGALEIGAADTVLTSSAGIPTWLALSAVLDIVAGGNPSPMGSVLVRNNVGWVALVPGVAGQVLETGGPGANPEWSPRTAEFSPGDTIVFQQSTAPVGWTKQTVLNDYGLRVTSGAVGVTTGAAFSTVFAQTAVGNTTLAASQIPSHVHAELGTPAVGVGAAGIANYTAFATGGGTVGFGNTDGGAVGGGAHSHSVNLALSYIDVIIASKD